jgi:hypothetical protein
MDGNWEEHLCFANDNYCSRQTAGDVVDKKKDYVD